VVETSRAVGDDCHLYCPLQPAVTSTTDGRIPFPPTRIHTEADPTRTVRFDAQHREHEAMSPKRTYITSAPPG
jgi:hypothetical protein